MDTATAKLLIVNADDFGITEGATDSIIECHRAGAVTSTTFMSTMPAAAYAADAARANPGLGVGLHFNLTLGEPLTRARRLTGPDGRLPNRGQLVRAVLTGRIRADDIRAELQAQHAAMLALGLKPTHLDSHQHVHVIPGVFGEVARFADANRLPLRMPWGWAGRVPGKTLKRRLKEAVLASTLRKLDQRRPKTLRTNDGFCSVFDLPVPAERLTVESYRELLAPYRSGVIELMVHPAYVDKALMQRTAITGTSDSEARLLTDSAFVALVEELGFVMGDLGMLEMRFERVSSDEVSVLPRCMASLASTAVDRVALYLIPLQLFVFSRLPLLAGSNVHLRTGLVLGVIGYYAATQFVWLNFATHSRYWVPYQFGPFA